MKKTKNITLSILPIIALSACADQDIKHCVDDDNVIVPDTNCASAHPRFHWYYGGQYMTKTSANGTPIKMISGGSHTPSVGKSYSSPSTIRGGGFGGIGRGFGGGS